MNQVNLISCREETHKMSNITHKMGGLSLNNMKTVQWTMRIKIYEHILLKNIDVSQEINAFNNVII